jgi:hypothetical protein
VSAKQNKTNSMKTPDKNNLKKARGTSVRTYNRNTIIVKVV